jgi:hypothetical protein
MSLTGVGLPHFHLECKITISEGKGKGRVSRHLIQGIPQKTPILGHSGSPSFLDG